MESYSPREAQKSQCFARQNTGLDFLDGSPQFALSSLDGWPRSGWLSAAWLNRSLRSRGMRGGFKNTYCLVDSLQLVNSDPIVSFSHSPTSTSASRILDESSDKGAEREKS